MFSQWIDGQPWWLTLLLLPAIVLAAVVVRAVHYGLIAVGGAVVLAVVGGVLWARGRKPKR